MISKTTQWTVYLLSTMLLPPLCAGVLRKTKARLQNRVGAPIYQPIADCFKLFGKREVLSSTMSGIFRFSTIFSLSTMLTLSWLVPWSAIKPWAPAADVFLIMYMFAAAKFFMLLGAADSASPFGAFAVGREAALNFLTEPVIALALVSLSLHANSSDLRIIFSNLHTGDPAVYLFAGLAILLASTVELSRMPIEDPNTHLELTMIHEALLLEASGKDLLAAEWSQSLKLVVLFGLVAQCFLHVVEDFIQFSIFQAEIFSVLIIIMLVVALGAVESVIVRLQWRKIPEFIAYGITLSLVCAFAAVVSKGNL